MHERNNLTIRGAVEERLAVGADRVIFGRAITMPALLRSLNQLTGPNLFQVLTVIEALLYNGGRDTLCRLIEARKRHAMLSLELREKVRQFIDGQLQISELEGWLMPRVSGYLADVDSEDADLIAAIELAFAELSDGLRDVDECRAYLREELQAHPAPLMVATEPVNVAGTCTPSQPVSTSFVQFEGISVS
jgi:hypothetical protein